MQQLAALPPLNQNSQIIQKVNLFGPTSTPTPTQTPSPSPTQTPAPTPTPQVIVVTATPKTDKNSLAPTVSVTPEASVSPTVMVSPTPTSAVVAGFTTQTAVLTGIIVVLVVLVMIQFIFPNLLKKKSQ